MTGVEARVMRKDVWIIHLLNSRAGPMDRLCGFVLARRYELRGASIAEIAQYMGTHPATASRALRRLEAEGWVRVIRGPHTQPNLYHLTLPDAP